MKVKSIYGDLREVPQIPRFETDENGNLPDFWINTLNDIINQKSKRLEKMNRETHIEEWSKKFVGLEGRKPNKTEKMSFKVGFNAAISHAENLFCNLEKISLCMACNLIHDGHLKKCNFQGCEGKVEHLYREKR